MSFKCLGDHILIRPLEEKYRGVLVIPATAKKDQPQMGVVIAMGPGMLMKNGKRWPMPDCRPGDTIIFNKHGGTSIELAGEKLRVIRDENVDAVLEM
jgi:chaperonin GroES